jgi:VanZ family protein
MSNSGKICHLHDTHSSGEVPVPASILKLTLFYRLPLFAFCLVLFWQSYFPSPLSAPLFPHDDKLMHMGAYAFLAFLAARNLHREKPLFSRTKLRILTILFACLYGLSDEIHQAFVIDRTASVWDFAADVLGSILGACFYFDFLNKNR